MEEDTEFKKLPVDERVVHKLWKARVHGYEELTKLFRQIDDEKSPEFAKYLGLVKKFVIDSNAMGQEKGLEATLAYVENYANAGKTVGEVMSGIVTKCIAAPKTKTRELAVQLTLMYVEIEKQEQVQEELVKGMDSKNPKIVAACISATTLALHEFGSKVINVKPLIKKMPTLLADRDKTVRDETKNMVVEIFRWIGNALRSQLTNLQAVQVTELETEFAKVSNEKVSPIRYLRSQQERQAKIAAEAGDAAEPEDDETDAPPEIDPYDLVDPVNILAKLPNDFYEKVEAKKWQERKEAVEAVENLVKAPKLESGDYGDLVRALKKIISKDSNVMVVATAGKCLAGLANGLKKRFQPYAGNCVPALLEKFREKKQNVVLALREALDAIFISTTLEAIVEDVLEALNNKNPAVKAETAAFLTRSFTKCQPAALNKKMLKAYTGALLKTLNEPDPTVRDNSAEALGTAMKLVGEKAIAPFVVEVDNLKMAKIKECCDKAVIVVKVAAPKKERPTSVPSKSETPAAASKAASIPAAAPKAVKRPNTTGTAIKKKPITAAAASKTKAKTSKAPSEHEMTPEEIDDKASELFENDTLSMLADANWKNRLAAAEKFQTNIQQLESGSVSAQILIGVLVKKPGLKDTNIQVLKCKLETVKTIAETHKFSTVSANLCLNDVTDKLGDTKTTTLAGDVLTAIAEATKLEHVAGTVLDYSFNQKNPKVQQEALVWVSNAIRDFGFVVNGKQIIETAKKGISATNPAVRTSAITLVGTLYLYMGNAIHMFFENEKPALKQQIDAEFNKHENEKPPDPIRGLSKSGKAASSNHLDDVNEEDDESAPAVFNVQDLLPRVDISNQITEALINELADKNWKVRNEALQKVQNILSEAKLIEPNIGDLAQALALRLVDSNGKIVQSAIQICQTIATAMGPPCKQHVRVLFPGLLQSLSDLKNWIRSASIACINTWGDTCGYKEFFDGEMIGDALKTGSPTLRIELWAWLAEKLDKITLKSIPKEELTICIPILYTNLEDRNADVRKNAQDTVLPFMIHLGFDAMSKQTEKLKPGSKTVVMGLLEKARPSLPVKPLPASKAKPASADQSKIGKIGAKNDVNKNTSSASTTTSKSRVSTVGKPTVSRKKDDDIDTSPLLLVNNLKHQRVIDEQKLKVLKWNFTQPREEFVDLLKDQMSAANVNKTLLSNMFHIDFRYHLKAIEMLTEDVQGNHAALISNLDLILKWLTLRFFDTNPSVLLKGLEYLQIVFAMLIENKHILLESEASSFIPYLILKVGDPKDAVRNGVKALFKQIAMIYPVSRLFSYIMEGLKSKNARQRSECLEELGSLIEDYGISVCQPSPVAAMKEVAKHISDRDNSVRNAALNCIVNAYFIEGEKIYKMVGQISDKDHSLLEERIKRASKKASSGQRQSRIVVPPSAHQLSPQAKESPVSVTPLNREHSDLDQKSDEEPEMAPPPSIITNNPRKLSSTQQYHQALSETTTVINTTSSTNSKIHNINNRNNNNNVSTTTTATTILLDNSNKMSETTTSAMQSTTTLQQQQQQQQQQPSTTSTCMDTNMNPSEDNLKPNANTNPNSKSPKHVEVRRSSPPPQPAVSGPFGLDTDLLYQLEKTPARVRIPQVIEMDLNFLDDPVPRLSEIYKNTSSLPIPKAIPPPPSPIIPPSNHHQQHQNYATITRPSVSSVVSNSRVGQELLLEKTINQIASPDLKVALAAIKQMEDILHTNKVQLMMEFEDQFMAANTLQFKLLHSQNLNTNPDVLKTYRALLTILSTFYDTKVLGKKVSRDALKDILNELISLLVDSKLENVQSGDAYNRVINLQCVGIIEKSDHTHIICALIRLLHECVDSSCSPRFLDLVMKCLWRVIKIIPTWQDEIEYDIVLYEIHLFFKDFPSSWWKHRPSDTPSRTVKTILHSMAKIKGNTLMAHMTKIPNPNESELQAYLLKLLKTLKLEEVKQIPLKKEIKRPISRQVHNMLTEIFQKIGSKEATKEGLMLLYDFKQQHPETEIQPYLERATPFFQEYIERGLKDIEMARKKASLNNATEQSENIEPNPQKLQQSLLQLQQKQEQKQDQKQEDTGDAKCNPDYWMNRLKMWQNVITTTSGSTSPSHTLDNKLKDENLNTNMNRDTDVSACTKFCSQ